jgi:hypothetical protein
LDFSKIATAISTATGVSFSKEAAKQVVEANRKNDHLVGTCIAKATNCSRISALTNNEDGSFTQEDKDLPPFASPVAGTESTATMEDPLGVGFQPLVEQVVDLGVLVGRLELVYMPRNCVLMPFNNSICHAGIIEVEHKSNTL